MTRLVIGQYHIESLINVNFPNNNDFEVQLPHWGTVRCPEEFCQANSSRDCLGTCNVSLQISQHYDGLVKVNEAIEYETHCNF